MKYYYKIILSLTILSLMSVGWGQSQTENFTQEEINLDDYFPDGNPRYNPSAIISRDLGDYIYSCTLGSSYDQVRIDWYEGYLWFVEAGFPDNGGPDGLVYKLDVESCEIIETITINLTEVCDIEWINDYLWVTDCGADMIYKYDNDGSYILSFPTPSGGSVGIAWDGEYLWDICYQTNTIHQIDPNTGEVIYQTSTPYYNNITLEFENGYLWTISRSYQMTYKFDPFTNETITSFDNPLGSFYAGLTFDGQFLWTNYAYSIDTIYKIDIEYEGSGSGCTDPSACNYNPNATEDDGSCAYEEDCAGECGGSAEVDNCGVCDGDGSSCGGDDITDGCDLPYSETTGYLHLTADGSVLYKTLYDIGGFQFDVDGAAVNSASGGDAGSAGMLIQASGNLVLAFSLTGATIPAGCGTLVELNLTGDATGLSGIIMSDATGGQLYFEYYEGGGDECPSGIYDCAGVCDGDAVEDECGVCGGDNSSCLDCAGVPNGDSELDNCGVCDNDSSNDCVQDCAGEWGGDAELDECGVCEGSGPEYVCEDDSIVCGESNCPADCEAPVCLSIENVDIDAGTLDIYMTNLEPVGGFQFNLFGITIIDIWGGSASQYFDFLDFNSNTGIILGASISGGSIPAGESLLVQVSFTDYLGSDLCFGTDPSNNVISDTTGIEIETDWGDCYCDPSNPEDDCGVCGGPGAIYECGCNDISAVDNDTENIITVTSYSWFEDLHYDFTFTIGDIIWQNMENAERRIDELRVYCYETGQIWEFDSDQLRSGTRDRDYSEVMDKYEDFTPPDNRPTDAYLYGWAGGTGNYFWLEFNGYAWSDEGDYFDFWMTFDFWPGDEISFPNLEFEYGEFNSSYMPTWWAEGSFDSHFLDEWNYLQDQVMTIGLPACDCDGNVENMCGECDNDPENDCAEDCLGEWGGDAVIDACGECDGGVTDFDDCADISVSPESLSQQLESGESATQTLTISNDGGSDLEWETTSSSRNSQLLNPHDMPDYDFTPPTGSPYTENYNNQGNNQDHLPNLAHYRDSCHHQW